VERSDLSVIVQQLPRLVMIVSHNKTLLHRLQSNRRKNVLLNKTLILESSIYFVSLKKQKRDHQGPEP
jgi:hypothetical protein